MFEDEINQFARNMNSLRGFLSLLGPFLDQHTMDVTKNNIRDFAPIFYAITKTDPKLNEKLTLSEQDIQTVFDGHFEVHEQVDASGKKS